MLFGVEVCLFYMSMMVFFFFLLMVGSMVYVSGARRAWT